MTTFEFKCTMLKQDSKSKTEKLKYQKKIIERKKINKLFYKDPKKVYRTMKGSAITPKCIPSKQNVETFWKGIWNNPSECNVANVDWMKELESNYCLNATQKLYEIDKMTIDNAINKLKPNKAPGRDMITGYWYKQLNFYRSDLTRLYNSALVNYQVLPYWLSTAKTTLLPKNTDTHIAKNYRPIALLNMMSKIFTASINMLLTDHVLHNNYITNEQAEETKGTWGTTEQLLINKSILKEVKNSRKNLVTVWLGYRKAFDSIPHSCLLQALKLAKVPEIIINAIKNLTKSWYTILSLSSETETLTKDPIKFLKGIFQGDSLSVMLFALCLNPLYFLLNKCKGYSFGRTRKLQRTHNFFVDDLKLYSQDLNSTKKQLDIITTFSRDVNMQFGEDKCAYLQIEKGKVMQNLKPISINGLTIKPIEEGDNCKYLGIDENISYNGPINKERVTKEYINRIRKIWNSQLSDFNKAVAHNAFAVPTLTSTVGILDWICKEINEIDIKTRKTLVMSASLHPYSDAVRLYFCRRDGERGIRAIRTMYESRIISIRQHLRNIKDKSEIH